MMNLYKSLKGKGIFFQCNYSNEHVCYGRVITGCQTCAHCAVLRALQLHKQITCIFNSITYNINKSHSIFVLKTTNTKLLPTVWPQRMK